MGGETRDANPCFRTTVKFELALGGISTDVTNEKELLGIIQGSEESPVANQVNSMKMRLTLMELFARHYEQLIFSNSIQ